MYRRLIVLITIILFSHGLYAQRVGLVLSGGGSKGVTHIGVIRALEEAEIPIDYITGTSMGAIIGGLYAAGYSPDDMEMIIGSREFQYWITGAIDPRYKYFFNSPSPNASWVDFNFYNDSILRPNLPTNIISPMSMDFAFMEIFSSAGAVANYNFDSLMVPFRCMAADISKAEQVILSGGDLGHAIRASSTFPFVFKPIKIDDILLFDGGMYNNFPADVMLNDFFPDIIIGSQAAADQTDPNPDNVLSQIQTMIMTKTDFNVLCDNSVLIKPILKSVPVIDFSHTKAFIDSGYYAAKRAVPLIREFITTKRTKQQADSIREAFNSKKPELVIDKINFNGLNKRQERYLNQLLSKESKGPSYNDYNKIPLTLSMVKPQYFRFIAEGKANHIFPRLLFNKDNGLFDMTLDIEKHNQLVAEIGGAITSSSVNELFLELKYILWTKRSIQYKVNSYFGRFYNSAMVETRIDYPKFNPYSISAGFVFNKFNYFKTSSTFFYADEDPFFQIQQEIFGYLNLAFPYKNTGKFTIDVPFGSTLDKYYQTNQFNKDDITDKTVFIFFAPGFSFEINTLNRKAYANSGSNLKLQFNLVNGKEEFTPGTVSVLNREQNIPHTWIQGQFTFENYFAQYKKISFGIYNQISLSTQAFFSNYSSSLLSAFSFAPVPQSEILYMPEYRSTQFVALGSKNVYSFSKNLNFRLDGYVQVAKGIQKDPVTEKLKVSPELKVNPIVSSALLYYTPLGPLSVELAYFSKEDKPLNFLVKFGYLIFNRRAF